MEIQRLLKLDEAIKYEIIGIEGKAESEQRMKVRQLYTNTAVDESVVTILTQDVESFQNWDL